MGTGRFEDVTSTAGEVFALSEVSRGPAFGDVDNDGDTDILVVNNNGPARLSMNGVGRRSPWVGVRAVEEGRDMLGEWSTRDDNARYGLKRLVGHFERHLRDR